MTNGSDLLSILDSRPHLLAVCEQLAPSMNGVAARRLVAAMDEVSLGLEFVDQLDRQWLDDAMAKAERQRRPAFWAREVERLQDDGVGILSCVDPSYPSNLAMTHDQPPALFVRGRLIDRDARAVAVVGTRTAGAQGLRMVSRLASELVESGVTIVSGLAKGIDTAAHAAAINAGGRTIAVYGTTIDKVYPAANRELARAVARSGACVSQFLPGGGTRRGPDHGVSRFATSPLRDSRSERSLLRRAKRQGRRCRRKQLWHTASASFWWRN